ncbi:MAG: hypothetical protein E7314_07130 [Clostridiales bacterium]|nr:hypothetical protein [Clostridiales bacterium]
MKKRKETKKRAYELMDEARLNRAYATGMSYEAYEAREKSIKRGKIIGFTIFCFIVLLPLAIHVLGLLINFVPLINIGAAALAIETIIGIFVMVISALG